jgi:hypothetical protein
VRSWRRSGGWPAEKNSGAAARSTPAAAGNLDRRHLSPEEREQTRAARKERVADGKRQGKSERQMAGEEGVSKSQVDRDLEELSTVPDGTVDDESHPDTEPSTEPAAGYVIGKDGRKRSAAVAFHSVV